MSHNGFVSNFYQKVSSTTKYSTSSCNFLEQKFCETKIKRQYYYNHKNVHPSIIYINIYAINKMIMCRSLVLHILHTQTSRFGMTYILFA